MTVPLMSIVDLDLKINYYTKIYFLRFLNKYWRENIFIGMALLGHHNYHWETVSGSKKDKNSFYDSLNNANILRVFLHQICDIVRPDTNC